MDIRHMEGTARAVATQASSSRTEDSRRRVSTPRRQGKEVTAASHTKVGTVGIHHMVANLIMVLALREGMAEDTERRRTIPRDESLFVVSHSSNHVSV